MDKVSIIIPARNEKNIVHTLFDIAKKARGDIEIIVGTNGSPYHINNLSIDSILGKGRIKAINFPENIGIKGNINTLALSASGKYLFKLDAHTSVGEGFDEILKADMQDDWIVMPRFKIIKDDWSIQMRDGKEEFYDYFFLSCPFTDKRGLRFKAGGHWGEKTAEKLDVLIDETPQIHGSGWFMTKDRFFELGGFPLQDPYGHGQEPVWIGLRNWLMGGKVMVNKKTWYAHLHQSSNQRGYPENRHHTEQTYNSVASYWLSDKEPNLLHKFDWFISEKFPNMPTWPNNSVELLKRWREQNA